MPSVGAAEVEVRSLFQTEHSKAFRGEQSLQPALASTRTQGDALVQDLWAVRKRRPVPAPGPARACGAGAGDAWAPAGA